MEIKLNPKKAERKKVTMTLNKKNFDYFRKYLNKNNLEFSFIIDDLLAHIIPSLKKGEKKFELNLNLEGEKSK